MKIYDRAERMRYGNSKFPVLKGHVKLTLRNVHNGKTEVIEGENIVTNAVKDIFANNYMGGIDYTKMMPLWSKWYGGVLAYEQAHANLDADKYFMRNDTAQKLIAHAGQAGIDVQHDDDLRAGNPTTSSFVQTENSIKQVWEWGTTHGNGTIRALSLCHTDVGDAGTGGTNYKFQNFSPFDLIQGSQLTLSNLSLLSDDNVFARYDDNHGLFFHIGAEGEFYYGRHTSFETKKLTIYIRRLPYFESGLFETGHARSENQRIFTVTTTGASMFMQPSYFFDISTKYLWIFYNNTSTCGTEQPHWWDGTWDNNTISYFVVDCDNEEIVDEGTIESDTDDIAPLSFALAASSGSSFTDFYVNASLVKDGDYVYFPTGQLVTWTDYSNYQATGYKKINIDNQSEQSSITFNATQNAFLSATKAGELIVNPGRVVNGNVGYTCTALLGENNRAFQDMNKVSFLAMPIGVGNESGTRARYLVANKLLNTTKYNLPSAVTKTASQSMTIEYTLTEV